MSMSLIQILQGDEGFQKRLAAKVSDVKQDKAKILTFSEQYSEKYKDEIEEGDKLRTNLLTEGSKRGLTEEQVMSTYRGGFLPAKTTPILNMLYFLLKESDEDQHYGSALWKKRDKINEYLKSSYKSEDEIVEEDVNLLDEIQRLLQENTKSEDKRKTINKSFEKESETRTSDEKVSVKDLEDVSQFLYGNLTLENFATVKKLKKLAMHNSNTAEAFSAFTKCKELCVKYGLEFDKIPSI